MTEENPYSTPRSSGVAAYDDREVSRGRRHLLVVLALNLATNAIVLVASLSDGDSSEFATTAVRFTIFLSLWGLAFVGKRWPSIILGVCCCLGLLVALTLIPMAPVPGVVMVLAMIYSGWVFLISKDVKSIAEAA